MSHLKERKEKICLNCRTELMARYCHVCGQENLEPKETVWHLVQHFFNDITHFDGKFFSTVKYLLRKPGFLSKEYMAGRRASYLNPIRMYVFTSAIFFLILFSIKRPDEIMNVKETTTTEKGESYIELQKSREKLQSQLAKEVDEDDKKDFKRRVTKLDMELAAIKKIYGDTTTRTFSKTDLGLLLARAVEDTLANAGVPGFRYPAGKGESAGKRADTGRKVVNGKGIEESNFDFFGTSKGRYRSVAAYDSAEKSLPDSLRDGWLERKMMEKMIQGQVDYHQDKRRYKEHFVENLLHSIPKILFISLPLFALILNILYFREKKTFYYVSHGIFTIHVYCATFILILLSVLVDKLGNLLAWEWVKVVTGVLIFGIVLYMMIYLYKAMRGFYGQGRAKTMIKYLITFFLAFIINSILFVLFLLISFISI